MFVITGGSYPAEVIPGGGVGRKLFSPMTPLTRAMGFDPSKAKCSAEEKKAESQARAEGTRNRQALIDSLLELITGVATDSDVLREARACGVFFPEGKQLVDRIESIYGDKPEVLKTVLPSAILAAVDRLL
jgi:hypothetical protein